MPLHREPGPLDPRRASDERAIALAREDPLDRLDALDLLECEHVGIDRAAMRVSAA